MKSYIVDTYDFVLRGKEKFREEIENNELYTPSIVIAEISRILKRKRVPKEKCMRITA